ncbi:MAG: hypothetical protein BWY80_00700 [Firmicutes bacterium ADurb.Bin456]|nr:MAG: hypothetical protein BWY80_00700 [Firmicutes bacterium ADurb.Bin456]
MPENRVAHGTYLFQDLELFFMFINKRDPIIGI